MRGNGLSRSRRLRASSTRIEEVTGIGPGETDLELKFSLETVNCLGCCALGPVMDVDGKIHSRLSSAEATKVLKDYE